MAKKHSTKTATKEALQASEPSFQVFKGFQGINIRDAAPNWESVTDENAQTDLQMNYLLVQNNVQTDPNLTLETRPRAVELAKAPEGRELTGICYMKAQTIYCAATNASGNTELWGFDVMEQTWHQIKFYLYKDGSALESELSDEYEITCIYSYLNNYEDYLIVLVRYKHDDINKGIMFTGQIGSYKVYEPNSIENPTGLPWVIGHHVDIAEWDGKNNSDATCYTQAVNYIKDNVNEINSSRYGGCISVDSYDTDINKDVLLDRYWYLLSNGTAAPSIIYKLNGVVSKISAAAAGITDTPGGETTNANIYYAYYNKFGQTKLSSKVYFRGGLSMANWTAYSYLSVYAPDADNAEGCAFYMQADESDEPVFMGNGVKISDAGGWKLEYYGASSSFDDWSGSNLEPDDRENTTSGPDASYCRMHDSRLYFWGSPTKPYRLIIGGNSKHELNVARGLGGAYIDIEPGIGTVITGTYKWKTTSGASIVTILTRNENTSQHKRFNLVENNITIDTEYAETSYMIEEISNTVGCQSVWGAGVWADGFYVLNRYGVTLTTMTMEYNTQIQSQLISEAVQPIFTAQLANFLENARMIHVDNRIYICFSTQTEDTSPHNLDNMILVYDLDTKSWFTYTYLGQSSDAATDIRHIMNIDYTKAPEGIGIICKDHIALIPTAALEQLSEPLSYVPYQLETGELSVSQPIQQSAYVAQLEFRFDYFVGDMDIDLYGCDYYGRHVHVHKHIHTDEVVNDLIDWMRVNYTLENYHLVFKGTGQCRLTHFISKIYSRGRKFNLTRGYDSLATYKNRHGGTDTTRHYIRNYANLREVVLT